MDLNPPFSMEDNTDEDFFDKLVDDEFGTGNVPEASAVTFNEGKDGDDSDEIKTFGLEDSGGLASKEESTVLSSDTGKGVTEDVSFVKPKAVEDMKAVEVIKDAVEPLVVKDVAKPVVNLEANEGKSSETASSGVKEVQWNQLFGDSSQNGIHDGFGSYSDFFSEFGTSEGGENLSGVSKDLNYHEEKVSNGDENLTGISGVSQVQHQQNQGLEEAVTQESATGLDTNSSQYWENLYPGWRYDPNSGQWYQIDSYDATGNSQVGFDNNTRSESVGSNVEQEISYLQQTAQSVSGSVMETNTTQTVASWNEVSQEIGGYPEHMVFDPQYPGWFYDTIAQEWQSLETYMARDQLSQANNQYNQDGVPTTDVLSNNSVSGADEQYNQSINYGSQGFGSQQQDGSWGGYSNDLQQSNICSNGTFSSITASSVYGQYGQTDDVASQSSVSQGQQMGTWGYSSTTFNQQGVSTWPPAPFSTSEVPKDFGVHEQSNNLHASINHVNNNADQVRPYNPAGLDLFSAKETAGRSLFPGENITQQFNQMRIEPKQQGHLTADYFSSQQSPNFSQQSFQAGQQPSYDPSAGRSSAGRPPHALVTFGFGGKLIVLKETSTFSSFSDKKQVGGSVSVLNLIEVVSEKNVSSMASGACAYFQTLSQQSFPGPLVGGNSGSKELNKWIDERIANCGIADMHSGKSEVLRLLLSLLKIACQHYGKLRSPFGSDASSKGSDTPESAVANLFASVRKNDTQASQYDVVTHCLQTLPSEGQLKATATEVQNLLVSGKKKDALDYAVQGQLWGPALVIASQLGDQFYGEAVKQMALRQLVPGSPLRTLCLLIAGQPQAVFSSESAADTSLSDGFTVYQQTQQYRAKSTLDDWEENLAIISANRTKDDELVIINLGDCLWRERSEILAAHICYLVAEANFEPYSESSRLCLIGSNHLKYPRTYASPDAIQRTELYEYSKVLGNSQFILLPFQPYKLIYAYMMVEVGKISDALKYCQATLKCLKTGRAPEVEIWRQLASSLEERIRTHQQGGYSSNLVSAKLVGKLLNFFDSTAHRVVGGLPPPVPSSSNGNTQSSDQLQQPLGSRVTTSQSTMAMSSLMPSSSTEQISEWKGPSSRMSMHNRSISEPDIGRTPRHVDPSKEANESDGLGKASSGASSRFARFGFGTQLLQKTVGLVLKSRTDRQAKLGESNKFYYDEKLKRWVEEGSEPPAEEAALPPPPTSATFQSGMSDQSLKTTYRTDSSSVNGTPDSNFPPAEQSSGIPPIPPGSSHFSARGRMGVRSRYVDTFNQGSAAPAKFFQSPSVPAVKRATAGANAKFFVPTPMASGEQVNSSISGNFQDGTVEHPIPASNSLHQASLPQPTLQRFPSMDNIDPVINGNGSLPPHSRRTASWGGSYSNAFSPPKASEVKPLGEMLGISPASFLPSEPSSMHLHSNGGSFPEELHEVEL